MDRIRLIASDMEVQLPFCGFLQCLATCYICFWRFSFPRFLLYITLF